MRADGFALFIAVCNSPLERDGIIGQLQESMAGAEPQIVIISQDTQDPLEEVLAQAKPVETGPIMIVGLEDAVRSDEPQHPILQALNLRRPDWPKRVPRSIVLWAPEYLLALMGRECPDFLDWRSDTIHFPACDPMHLKSLGAADFLGDLFSVLPDSDRRERMRELRSRLALHRHSDDPATLAVCSEWAEELGAHLAMLGDMGQSEEMLLQSLEQGESSGDQARVASVYKGLGTICSFRGEYTRSLEMFENATRIYRSADDAVGIASTYSLIGDAHKRHEDIERSAVMYSAAFEVYREHGQESDAARMRSALGDLSYQRGDLAAAEAMYREALETYAELGFEERIAEERRHLSAIHMSRNDLVLAEAALREALETDVRLGNEVAVAKDHSGLADVAVMQGDLAKAESELGLVVAICERLDHALDWASSLAALGTVHLARADISAARCSFARSLEIAENLDAGNICVPKIKAIVADYKAAIDKVEASRG